MRMSRDKMAGSINVPADITGSSYCWGFGQYTFSPRGVR